MNCLATLLRHCQHHHHHFPHHCSNGQLTLLYSVHFACKTHNHLGSSSNVSSSVTNNKLSTIAPLQCFIGRCSPVRQQTVSSCSGRSTEYCSLLTDGNNAFIRAIAAWQNCSKLPVIRKCSEVCRACVPPVGAWLCAQPCASRCLGGTTHGFEATAAALD